MGFLHADSAKASMCIAALGWVDVEIGQSAKRAGMPMVLNGDRTWRCQWGWRLAGRPEKIRRPMQRGRGEEEKQAISTAKRGLGVWVGECLGLRERECKTAGGW